MKLLIYVDTTSSLPLRTEWTRYLLPIIGVFSDRRIQFGIKMGLAGMLAFYVSQYLQIYNPIWALLTVMIVMLAKYVGAIAEKSLLRCIGTLIGGTIGVWLVGNYIQNGLLFLSILAVIVAYCTYRFGGTFYPYAFFLTALTLIVVANDSMATPNRVWWIALSRVEEILIGTMSAALVSSLVWPSYARQEFFEETQEFIRHVGEMATTLIRELKTQAGPPPFNPSRRLRFLDHLNHLRLLIQFGSRESIYFKAKVGTYSKVAGTLTSLHEAARDLAYRQFDQQLLTKEMGKALDDVYEGLKTEFAILSTPLKDDAEFPLGNLEEATEKLEERLLEMQRDLTLRNYPVSTVVEFGRHIVAIRKICDDAKELRKLLTALPRIGINLTRVPDEPKKTAGHIDIFWLRNGIKGALAVCVGLVFCNWVNPPGGSLITLFAWVFTVMSRGFLGGQGDRRCFRYVFLTAIWGIPVLLLVILICPLFTSYFFFNVTLFIALCIFGYSIAKTLPSLSYTSFLVLNILVAGFGVNFQQPVAFQTLFDSYMGTVLGLLISAVIQRTFWPVLPQWELRDRFVEFFTRAQVLLQRAPELSMNTARYRITLIPSEAASWAKLMTPPFCPEGENERLLNFNGTLLKLTHELQRLQEDKMADVPEIVKPRLRPVIQSFEAEVMVYFKDCAESFKKGVKCRLAPSLEKCLADLKSVILKIREDRLLVDEKMGAVLSYLSLVNHYESLAEALEDCDANIRNLRIESYWGDYSL